MLKKKFIFENDTEKDVDEMSDYEKILRLAKHSLNAREVDFENSEGEDFSDYIETTYDGIIFTFDGLQEFLSFFFPNEYGKEETQEGYWDAKTYEWMYTGNYDWYGDFSDRDSQDWGEGYITDSLRKNHLELVRDIAKFISPNLYVKLSKSLEKGSPIDPNLNIEIRDFLDVIDIGSDVLDMYTDANVSAVSDVVREGIEKKYCSSLKTLAIGRYSERYCFWKYEMSWGACLMLYARFGEVEDNFLDLLISSVSEVVKDHLPEAYEVQHEFWDSEKFDEVWGGGVTSILEKKLEEIENNPENYNEKYFEVLDKVLELGGVDKWIETKDGKYNIRINGIDTDTALITYSITKNGDWKSKSGKTDINSLIDIIYNEKLFDILEHIEKFSILRNKTIL